MVHSLKHIVCHQCTFPLVAESDALRLFAGTKEEVEQQGEEAEGEGQEGTEGERRGCLRH